MTGRERAVEFWTSFERQSEELLGLLGADETMRSAFEAVDRLLARSGFSMCFDLTSDEGGAGHLIFSPEGDLVVAREIDELVSFAPPLTRWRVWGRRQRCSPEHAMVIVRHALAVDLAGLRYGLVQRGSGWVVEASGDVLDDLSAGDVATVVSMLLWHAVGEETVMSLGLQVERAKAGSATMSLDGLVARLDGLGTNEALRTP